MSWLDWAFRPHPVYPLPSREQVEVATSTAAGMKKFQAMMEARGEKLRLENEDPFSNGFEPKHWKDADALIAEHSNVLISGGNRSGKTEYCAKYAVKHLMQNAKSRVGCLHTTHQSRLQTQRRKSSATGHPPAPAPSRSGTANQDGKFCPRREAAFCSSLSCILPTFGLGRP